MTKQEIITAINTFADTNANNDIQNMPPELQRAIKNLYKSAYSRGYADGEESRRETAKVEARKEVERIYEAKFNELAKLQDDETYKALAAVTTAVEKRCTIALGLMQEAVEILTNPTSAEL